MRQFVDIYEHTCTPAAVGSDETFTLRTLPKGTRILWASAEIVTRSEAGVATSTFSLGVTNSVQAFIANFNSDQVAGVIVNGAGASLAGSGGYLCTAAIALLVTYTNNTQGTTNPTVRFRIAYTKDWKYS